LKFLFIITIIITIKNKIIRRVVIIYIYNK
jgi:hypothetical protein